MSNKEKILASALALFNQNGMVNVRLQHIVDDAIVSLGNIAYHFENKGNIVLTIYQTLATRQDELLAEFRILPLFENFQLLLQKHFLLQQDYAFFYLDTLEVLRAYPNIAELHRQKIQSRILQLQSMIDFNTARGAFVMTDRTDSILLAQQIWQSMDGFLHHQAIKSSTAPTLTDFQKEIWHLLFPYFTQMGKQEYEQMLQNPYGDLLGE